MANLIENEAKKILHTGTALAIVVGGLGLTAVEVQPTLEIPTLLHGDGSRDRLNVLLLDWNGATPRMMQEVANDMFLIPPTDQFAGLVNVYWKHPTENLNFNQHAIGDWNAVNREVDRVTNSGIPIQASLVAVKSDLGGGDGNSFVSLRTLIPSNHNPSAVVIPENVGAFRQFFAAIIATEFYGHQLAGIHDEPNGNDMMASKTNDFNAEHTQYLIAVSKLWPFNYLMPRNEVKALNAAILTGQIYQAQEMSLSAIVFSPGGTRQLLSEVIPFNNDGAGVSDYITNPEVIHAWSEIGRKIPEPPLWYGLLPDMTYTWRVCTSGLAIPLTNPDGTVNRNDSRWTKVEGWPGVFFPNPCAETQVKTPKRFSDKIVLQTLSLGQETNNLTPTLVWDNGDKGVFYYEVQVSKDSNFETDPAQATAAVYWELRHGGVTNPPNSYAIPKESPLEPNTNYYWRVRPRIQGDGTPVAWSSAGSFKTSIDARMLSEGELEIIKNIEQPNWQAIQQDHWQSIIRGSNDS